MMTDEVVLRAVNWSSSECIDQITSTIVPVYFLNGTPVRSAGNLNRYDIVHAEARLYSRRFVLAGTLTDDACYRGGGCLTVFASQMSSKPEN